LQNEGAFARQGDVTEVLGISGKMQGTEGNRHGGLYSCYSGSRHVSGIQFLIAAIFLEHT
jgi:hypothetical protein